MHLLTTVSALLLTLVTYVAAVPTSAFDKLFDDPSIPILTNANLTGFNLTSATSHAATSKRAVNVQYVLYNIVMDGRNRGNYQNFALSGGQLLLTQGLPFGVTANGRNPYEVVVLLGSPAAQPVAGSIRYATNRYMYKLIGGANANAAVDYAFVSQSGATVTVQVDPRNAAANQLSQFNARTGLTAGVYNIASGAFSIVPGTSSITGLFNLVGAGYIAPANPPYRAALSGTVAGRGVLTI
jgi:hypothetical protein